MSSPHWMASSPPPPVPAAEEASDPMAKPTLQLSSLPPIFVSESHLDTCELHELEDDVVEAGGLLSTT
ncbi:unnamed protein product [Aureobasidium mustum]|uniref:Uncharacterized protein n=1 Tax=Aureobasidium mustum TaxID=2773714 RepID=A0A9N8K9Z0_9PEZI|nr:unnamed protein product [Aureobasidium mustum]